MESSRALPRACPRNVLVALDAKSYEILSQIIAEAAPRLNVVNLKIFTPPAPLASSTVTFQDFTA